MENELIFKQKVADYDCAITVKLDDYSNMNVCFARMPDPDIANEMYELTNYALLILYEDECEFDINSNKSCLKTLERERNIYNFEIPPIYDAIRLAEELRDNLTKKFNFSVRLIIKGNHNCKFIKAKTPN